MELHHHCQQSRLSCNPAAQTGEARPALLLMMCEPKLNIVRNKYFVIFLHKNINFKGIYAVFFADLEMSSIMLFGANFLDKNTISPFFPLFATMLGEPGQ